MATARTNLKWKISLVNYPITKMPVISHDCDMDVKMALEHLSVKIREVIVLYYMDYLAVTYF